MSRRAKVREETFPEAESVARQGEIALPVPLADRRPQDEVLFLSRILFGGVMMYYGWPKIKDLKSNGNSFSEMGFKPGILWGTLIAATEFFGGLSVALGMFSWLGTSFFGMEMLTGTAWKIGQTEKKFSDYSYDMLLFALALFLLTLGPDKYSAERIVRKSE